ncbi:MAG: HD domain-containing protein [Bacteroidaceae bacterium]|nr:HD domain-containing protein [Bacteroidaceae bacterium]
MGNAYLNTELVDKAIKFAVDAHANTERRGKGFPYVIHVLEAMEIVATITKDPELLAAAALHDTVEDTDVTVDQVRAEFGERIAKLVDAETTGMVDGLTETESWRMRRESSLKRLAASSRDAKIVAMGDKLSNMRAIAHDYRQIREELWNRFHAPNGKLDYAWYYQGLGDALKDLANTDAHCEYCELFRKVFG